MAEATTPSGHHATGRCRAGFGDLPTEIIEQLFRYLPVRDRGRLAQVNRRAAHIARTSGFADVTTYPVYNVEGAALVLAKRLPGARVYDYGAFLAIMEAYDQRPYKLTTLMLDELKPMPGAVALPLSFPSS